MEIATVLSIFISSLLICSRFTRSFWRAWRV